MTLGQWLAGFGDEQRDIGQAAPAHGTDQFMSLGIVRRSDDDDNHPQAGNFHPVDEGAHGDRDAIHFGRERLDQRVAAVAIGGVGRHEKQPAQQRNHDAVGARRVLIEHEPAAYDERVGIVRHGYG